MIPYVEIPSLEVGFIKVEPFIVCVGISVIIAFCLTLNRAKEVGLDVKIIYRMAIWIVFGSFFAAHTFSLLFDFPGRLFEKPWEILFIWAPMSSMGGFLGAFLVAFVFSRLYHIPLLAYSDALVWGFIPGWIVGRLGCSLVHDHPGIPSTFILAVQYPDGARHDLGFYEFLFTLLILWPLSLYIGKKLRTQGLLTSIIALIYMPVRFSLDFLRASDDIPGSDLRYGNLTPAQWVCIPLFVVTIVLLMRILQKRR